MAQPISAQKSSGQKSPGQPFTAQHLAVRAFRVVAFLEAASWIGLLIAMFFQLALGDDKAVSIPGMVHGIVFIVFVLLTLTVARIQRWKASTVLRGLLSTLPPLCSVWFEAWAQRSGRLNTGFDEGGLKGEKAVETAT